MSSQELPKTIFGIVSDDYGVLKDVNIIVKGSDIGVTSDNEGKYRIQAKEGDILVFSRIAMLPVEIRIEDVTRVLNIKMAPKIEELEEVVVAKRKRRTQQYFAREYYRDSSIINTNFGYLSPDLVGYELRVVNGKDLSPNRRDILDAIAEQLPGVRVRTIKGERYLFASSLGSLRGAASMAFEVDGHVRKDAPVGLDIEKVLRVGLIPGDQAYHKYGSVGSGGMVVINTTDVRHGSKEDGDRPFDLARLRGNIYDGDAISSDDIIKYEPNYIRALYHTDDFETAKNVYLEQSKIYGNSYFFVLEMYRIFREKFGEAAFANEILDVHVDVFEADPKALKALAYILQSYGDFEAANDMYIEVFTMRPEYAQSYIDLGRSYVEIGQYPKAASMYARFNYLTELGLMSIGDSSVFQPIIKREIDNLVTLNGKEMLAKSEREVDVSEEEFLGTRLVFEWNDSEAEFELQFVNPDGHYFNVDHTLESDPRRIYDEKLLGYSCSEFLIDDSIKGVWQINLKYLGNRSLTPSYLKATIYYNYGSQSQEKEIKVFKMGLKNVSRELFKVDNTTSMSSH